MQFKTIPVDKALQPYIRNYWLLQFRSLPPEGSVRIMTNGAPSMMFFLGKKCIVSWEEEKDGTQTSHFLKSTSLVFHGASMHNFTIHFPPGELCVAGVEFHPAGVHAFFEEASGLFIDKHIAGTDLGEDFVALEQDLMVAQAQEEYVDIADKFFIKRLNAIGREKDINMQRMMKVFAYIETHHPAEIKLANLASEACLSPRQFNRIFTEYVGLTPKEYLRIYRFHATLLSLREHPKHTTLMQLAWDNGYYDLQHMNSDFKDLCTQTPTSAIQMGKQLTEVFGQEFSLLMKKKILQENIE